MIDEKKLAELREIWNHGDKQLLANPDLMVDYWQTIESLWKENAELKAKLDHIGDANGKKP